MSYILEALKKSQQERELGRVPTLDTSGMFTEDKEPVPTSHWGLLAVGLAAVAVVIALYAVLRTPPPVPLPLQAGAEPEAAAAPMSTSTPALSAADSGQAPADAQPMIAPDGADLPASSPGSSQAQTSPHRSGVADASAREPRVPGPDPGLFPGEAPLFPAEPDLWLEQELQRQLDAEQAAYAEPPAPRRRPQRAAVPPDLVEDIESFKQQVRREQGIPPPLEQRQPADIRGDPTKLRLTPLQQAQLPAYFMTVHVYDEDVAKRFVHINALRYVEGEETRDGIRIERIIPEGAVLSYLGNPFFVRR
ncbi:general secretion pathway protein GspB [Thiocapsa rosea]|uniref:General secretion pathway protein B n=1 Tax=Thiocapsa rosea TaxID=69360 RepID=A0A495VAD8_9GAMM|nr:general secretion pathway protein GspB [Thiocapsa rosea]RKT45327.1 general secretion pathway protein B [Thiocapsa rosea]